MTALIRALDTLIALPADTPPQRYAEIAHDLIGGRRTTFFALDETGIARNGIDHLGRPTFRPAPAAPDLVPVYVGSDESDGLAPLFDLEPGTWVAMRLDAHDTCGALIADGLAGAPDDGTLHEWRIFAGTLGMRLALAHLYLDTKRELDTDSLTRVSTRAVAFAAIERRLAEAVPTTVIVVDLDGFKSINDTLGHDAGDQILVRAARALRTACRPADIVARYGGDEFVVVSSARPDQLLARLTDAMAATAIKASIGAASAPEDATTATDLFNAADAAMYAKKRSKPPPLQVTATA